MTSRSAIVCEVLAVAGSYGFWRWMGDGEEGVRVHPVSPEVLAVEGKLGPVG